MKGSLISFTLFLILLVQNTSSKQLSCLTGFKILTRKHITDVETKKVRYKFQYQCLCPNNYFGTQCQHHIGMDCYLSQNHQQLSTIDETNISQEMNLDMNFFVDCWVSSKSTLHIKTKLVDYLKNYNEKNAFGVREQFGHSVDVVWANTTTDIFDQKGQFKIISEMQSQNQTYQLSEQEKLNLLIGNNTQLYNNPFNYQSNFLGYGLINGHVNYNLSVCNPQKGMILIKNYTDKDVIIAQDKKVVDPQNPFRKVTDRRNRNLVDNKVSQKDDSKQFQKESFNEDSKPINIDDIPLDQQWKDEYNKYIDFLNDKRQELSSISIQYQIKLPITINPYNTTFYSAIKLSLVISETYQSILTHQISLNSYDMTIPVNVPNIGYEPTLHKNLTVTSQGYKTYYKIIIVVGIILVLYFSLTFGYKKYKQYKQKSLQQSQHDIKLKQQPLREESFRA